ncbi:MAG TPA: DivIVA domain-containing protein [Thermoleophilia bacterium]|nr:DivIVA domain-containing protein [Thermoleophilia bacterium]
MKVTPLDIRRKEFKRGMRGYADEEVDVFLDDVADEFERLFQENMELQDRMQRMEEQIAGHVQLKNALEKTLVSAQLQADQVVANARKEAELILRDAELKARHIVNDSYGETQRVQQTLVQLKHLEEDFRFKFRSLLEGHLKLLDEVRISESQAAAAVITPEAGAEAAVTVFEADETLSALSGGVTPAEATPVLAAQPVVAATEPIFVAKPTFATGEPLVVAEPLVAPEPFAAAAPLTAAQAVAALSIDAATVPDSDLSPEDAPTAETEAEDAAAIAGETGEETAGAIPDEATAEEATGELVGDENDDQTGDERVGSPRGFYFGKRIARSEEGFFSPDAPVDEKGRDFEW